MPASVLGEGDERGESHGVEGNPGVGHAIVAGYTDEGRNLTEAMVGDMVSIFVGSVQRSLVATMQQMHVENLQRNAEAEVRFTFFLDVIQFRVVRWSPRMGAWTVDVIRGRGQFFISSPPISGQFLRVEFNPHYFQLFDVFVLS